MDSFYVVQPGELFPIFGVASLSEAKSFINCQPNETVVASAEDVYLNPNTGSVDFESGWDNLDGLILVDFSVDLECWVEKDD